MNVMDCKNLDDFLSSSKITVYLTHRSGRIFLKSEQKIVIQDDLNNSTILNLDKIRRIVMIGRLADVDCNVFYRCMIKKIPIDFLDIKGNSQGQLLFDNNDCEYYIEQQNRLSYEAALSFAKSLVITKICNCKEVIRRRISHDKLFNLQFHKCRVSLAPTLEQIRGEEGFAARKYFQIWKSILGDDYFSSRQMHPSPDPVNSLLSFGYTLLRNRMTSALKSAGLNPRIGFFHAQRGRHCALTSDLMEQFRPYVDTTVMSLFNRKQLSSDNFKVSENSNMCFLADSESFRKVLHSFEEMFTKIYPAYFGYDSNFRFCRRSLNDMLDDTAENYAYMLQNKANFCTWRISA